MDLTKSERLLEALIDEIRELKEAVNKINEELDLTNKYSFAKQITEELDWTKDHSLASVIVKSLREIEHK